MSQKSGQSRLWQNIRTIASLTVDILFWSRKTFFIASICALILGFSVLGRLILNYHWIHAPFSPSQFFSFLLSTAIVHFLVVLVTLFYGTALISEEVEGKTLTYLFVRPIPKPTILLGKFLALVWISSILVVPTMIMSFVCLFPESDAFLDNVVALGKDIGIVLLAILAYGSFFSLLGAWLKHSMLAGLIYAFGWEGIVAYLPGFARQLTITHYIQSMFPDENRAMAVSMVIGQRASPAESIFTLTLMCVLFLSVASLVLREKEYVLDQ
jgi:ABC-2 type transport system permease protein